MSDQFDAENVAQRLPIMKHLLEYLVWDGPVGTDPGFPSQAKLVETLRVLIKRDEVAG